MECCHVHRRKDTMTNTPTKRQASLTPGSRTGIGFLLDLKESHAAPATSASAQATGKRASRYFTSVTNPSPGPIRLNGKSNQVSRLCGPYRREKTGAASHHSERNHSLAYGNKGLPQCVHNTYAQGPREIAS